LSGKLRAQREVDEALTSKDAENAWLHSQLEAERAYSKEIVRELQEQNDAVRTEVFPSMTAMINHVLVEKANKHVS
jgi:hypothetical protein